MYLSSYCEIWCLAQFLGAESKNSTFEDQKPILTPLVFFSQADHSIVQIDISSEPIDRL